MKWRGPVLLSLVFASLLLSGCAGGPPQETTPGNLLISSVSPGVLKLREGQSDTLTLIVENNGTGTVENLAVSGMSGGFSISAGAPRNLAAKTEGQALPKTDLQVRATAPALTGAPSNATLTLTYTSNGPRTKSVEVPVKILPDAKLQFVGLADAEDKIRTQQEQKLTTTKAGTIWATYSTKNDGPSTIESETLRIKVDVKEDRMGKDNQTLVKEAMARKGSSYTYGVPITVPTDAPNGETDIEVRLETLDGEFLDSKMLVLVVRL